MGLKDLFNFKAAGRTIEAAKKDVKKPAAKVVKLDDQRNKNAGKK